MKMKKEKKVKPTTVIFPVKMFEALKELAVKNNRSVAGQVRAMLQEQLEGNN